MSKIRAKEVGLRKTFGAYKSNIISQFFIESILISLFAFILALALIELFIPILSNLSGVENNISLIRNQSFIYIIFAVVVLTSIMAGTYPAIYFTSIQPVKALKGIFIKGTQKSVFRNILVIIQFTICIFLIISTMTIYKQMSFIYGSDLGYDKHNLIYLFMLDDSYKRYETIKNEFLKNPYIFNVTSTSRLPLSEGDSSSSYIWEGKLANQSILFNRLTVDNNYIEAMGMQMASGRTFRQKKRYSEEGVKEYILNEEAIRRMEIESPIGKKFGHGQEMDGTIIGIVKDFHFATLREEIEPLVIYVSPEETQLILIRISPMKIPETINYLESTWQKINPSIPCSYNFLDERITRLYSAEEQMAKLFRYFALLAIFIGSIGLYGLSSFTTEQRTKEIGVRKVFGASVPRIIIMLYREFSKLAIIASVIAWPIAYVAMKSWLQGFAYRTTIGLMSFILSSAIVLIIAIATVSYRTLKAAYANPIEALRYE
jgi:hypothetical protein